MYRVLSQSELPAARYSSCWGKLSERMRRLPEHSRMCHAAHTVKIKRVNKETHRQADRQTDIWILIFMFAWHKISKHLKRKATHILCR